jgi:hypothetical protein
MGWGTFFDEGWESITHQEVSERNKFCTMLSIADRENLLFVEILLCLQCCSADIAAILQPFVLNKVSPIYNIKVNSRYITCQHQTNVTIQNTISMTTKFWTAEFHLI